MISTWSSGSHSHCTKLWLYCSKKQVVIVIVANCYYIVANKKQLVMVIVTNCDYIVEKKHNFYTSSLTTKKISAQLQITKKLQLFEVISIFYPDFSIIEVISRLFYSQNFQFSFFLDRTSLDFVAKTLDFVAKISKLWCDLSRRRSNLFLFGQKFLQATIFLYKFWDL